MKEWSLTTSVLLVLAALGCVAYPACLNVFTFLLCIWLFRNVIASLAILPAYFFPKLDDMVENKVVKVDNGISNGMNLLFDVLLGSLLAAYGHWWLVSAVVVIIITDMSNQAAFGLIEKRRAEQ